MARVQDNPAVILTGASKGLGLATLQILLAQGASVTAMSRSETPELRSLADKYQGALIIYLGDVSKEEHNKEAVDVTMQAFSRLDALILNAGTVTFGTTASFVDRMDEYKSVFDVNYFSLVSIIGHALPHLKEANGRIVLVSSGAATGGVVSWGAYSASKAAMNSLARTLANEEPSVTTIALRPGVVDTAMQEQIRSSGGSHMKAEEHARFTNLHKDGKLVKAELPGAVMANLALRGKKELSGEFVSWDEEKCADYRAA